MRTDRLEAKKVKTAEEFIESKEKDGEVDKKQLDEVFDKSQKEEVKPKVEPKPKPLKLGFDVETAELRIEAITEKFEKMRKRTKATTEVKAVQEEVVKALEESNLKGLKQFIRPLKNIQTIDQFNLKFPKIQEQIIQAVEREARTNVKTKINKALKSAKTKKQAGKVVGKFTPETQGALDLIKTAIKMDQTTALNTIQENIDKSVGLLPSEDIALQNEVLSLFSDFDNKSSTDLVDLLDLINTLKKEGKEAREFLRTERGEHLSELRTTVVDQVTGGKGVKKGVETTGPRKTFPEVFKGFLKGMGTRWIGHWNTYMDTIDFNAGVENKKLSKLFSVLNQENAYKDAEYKFREKFDNALLDSYKLKSEKKGVKGTIDNVVSVHKKIHNLSKEINLGKFKNADGVDVELVFTKDELIKRWMELQDPTLAESLAEGNKYTPKIIANKQFGLYKEQWRKINPLYRKFFGVNLAFNEFYSPIAREGFKVDTSKGLNQLVEDNSFRVAVSVKSIKGRVSTKLPLKLRSSIYTLENHFKETDYFIAWAEKIKELEATFKDNEVRAAIDQEFSSGVYKAIVKKIEHLANKGNINAQRYPVIDFFRKGFTVGRLMLKPALTVKQFVSTIAYYENVGIADFVEGAIDFWKNPIENYKTLQKESVFVRTRGSGMERDMKAATQAGLADKFFSTKALANLLLVNNRIGDKGAIVWGSWILRKARLKQNIDIKEIINEYEEFGADTQQSADISRLTEVQLGGSIERLFTMFKTSQRQYLAKELTAVRSLFQKGGTSAKNIKKVAKTVAIYHILLPMMFQYIANGGGWDEDDQKEYIRAGILGSINGLFIFGDAIDSIIRKALGLRPYSLEVPILDVTNSVKSAIGKIDWDDITMEDAFEAFSALSEAGDSFYLPVSTVKNFGAGVSDLIDGNVRQGILQMSGWSRFIVGDDQQKGKKEFK